MIREKTLYCKLLLTDISTEQAYSQCLADLQIFKTACISCGAEGSLMRFAFYKRWVIDLIKGRPVAHQIRVLRLMCGSCGHTHAILPDCIIPYSQYSLVFILKTLSLVFLHADTLERICEKEKITPAQIYRWKKLYLEHRSLWLTAAERLVASEGDLLDRILKLPVPSDFLWQFYRLAGRSFLQSHRNAANSLRPPN